MTRRQRFCEEVPANAPAAPTVLVGCVGYREPAGEALPFPAAVLALSPRERAPRRTTLARIVPEAPIESAIRGDVDQARHDALGAKAADNDAAVGVGPLRSEPIDFRDAGCQATPTLGLSRQPAVRRLRAPRVARSRPRFLPGDDDGSIRLPSLGGGDHAATGGHWERRTARAGHGVEPTVAAAASQAVIASVRRGQSAKRREHRSEKRTKPSRATALKFMSASFVRRVFLRT